MLHKTRGIVFRFTKYGETSIIVNIFTELFGLQGYIVNGVRSKSSKSRMALFQPLTPLDMVVYHRANANLNRIKEMKCLHPFHSIQTDVKKSAISIFINEVLNKTVKEESHAQEVFDFLFDAVCVLDGMKDTYENFHLMFMLKLSRYLGFGAQNINEVLGVRVTDKETEDALKKLMLSDYREHVNISNDQRRIILELILKFYSDHIDTFGEMRSVQILKEVVS
jgi:DNA repair protein RecO (recombination protein O)